MGSPRAGSFYDREIYRYMYIYIYIYAYDTIPFLCFMINLRRGCNLAGLVHHWALTVWNRVGNSQASHHAIVSFKKNLTNTAVTAGRHTPENYHDDRWKIHQNS